MPQLSVIIITKNAANDIDACLNSVSFADEIIVLDSGSTDDTVARSRLWTDQVMITSDWPGFGPQKNRALAQATGEWVFSIDADEIVPLALQQEIKAAIDHSTYTAFFIPRQSHYCGRLIKYSGWRSDYIIRLFRRDSACFTNDLVHEKIQVLRGQVGQLKTPIFHYSFHSLEEVLDKVNHYSSAKAQMSYHAGKSSNLKKAIFHGLWAFIRTYLLQAGFLDGREGFMLAISNAEGTYYHYLKLMYLQGNKD